MAVFFVKWHLIFPPLNHKRHWSNSNFYDKVHCYKVFKAFKFIAQWFFLKKEKGASFFFFSLNEGGLHRWIQPLLNATCYAYGLFPWGHIHGVRGLPCLVPQRKEPLSEIWRNKEDLGVNKGRMGWETHRRHRKPASPQYRKCQKHWENFD